jgi:Flp pilus assembly protein TadD
MKTLAWILSAVVLLSSAPAYADSNKENFFNYAAQGHIYLNEGNTRSAIEAYRKALSESPDSPSVLFNLAIAYYVEKDLLNAASALEKLLSLEPEDAEAHYNLGHVLLLQKNIGGARLHLEKAGKLPGCPSRFQPLIRQGLALIGDLENLDPFRRDLAFFVLQNQAGLTPASVTI